jgi:hypothetical protein
MIASHQEVSGVQVASYLMNFGDHYTTHTFMNLFLFSIENYLQTELIRARLRVKDIDENIKDVNRFDCTDIDRKNNESFRYVRLFYDDHEEDETKMTEEQFLLEKTTRKNENTYVMVNTRVDYQHRLKDLSTLCLYDFVSQFHKQVIDKSDQRELKNVNRSHGERLCTEGTKMNERHTFENTHPQSSSHILIKRNRPVVPVLLGPQIPRRDREDTHDRYCRALLTLFVPWRSINDLCILAESWSEALKARKHLISDDALRIIENIQLLHECKNDRDQHLLQIIAAADNDSKIDPLLIPDGYEKK